MKKRHNLFALATLIIALALAGCSGDSDDNLAALAALLQSPDSGIQLPASMEYSQDGELLYETNFTYSFGQDNLVVDIRLVENAGGELAMALGEWPGGEGSRITFGYDALTQRVLMYDALGAIDCSFYYTWTGTTDVSVIKYDNGDADTGTPDDRDDCVYAPYMRLTSQIDYNPAGEGWDPTKKKVYSYDDGGNTIEYTLADWNGADWGANVTQDTWDNTYNDDDQLTKRINDDDNNETVDPSYTYEYYGSGLLHIEKKYHGDVDDGGTLDQRTTFTYDNAGRLLQKKKELFANGVVTNTMLNDYTWSSADTGGADVSAFTPAAIAILFDLM